MKRLDANISSLDGPLQERPEVLKAISVDRAINVLFGVVDYLVSVFIESVIVLQSVCVKFRAGRNVVTNLLVDVALPSCADDASVNPASLPIQKTEHNSFALQGRVRESFPRACACAYSALRRR
jgi:hypothetical protein